MKDLEMKTVNEAGALVTNQKKTYERPTLGVLDVKTEKGYATSTVEPEPMKQTDSPINATDWNRKSW